jgi:hypothetical protein
MFASTDEQILQAMERYGGSFIQALVVLYRKADPTNQRKLTVAFHDYFVEYDDLAKLTKQQQRP